jgi:phage I-like protein
MLPLVSFLETCSVLPVSDADTVPDWIMVLPAGTSKGVDGRGPFKLEQPEVVVATSIQGGRPLAMDYNHQTVFAALQGQESPASGWMDRLEVRDGAIWAHVDWTERGRLAVAGREYRYVSPAFLHDADGQVTKLVSVGLVNAPNLTELPAINARIGALLSPPRSNGDTMDEAQMARLRAALGLDANAGADAIVTHAEQRRVATPGAPDPSRYVPIEAFAELQTTVAALTKASSDNRAAQMVDDATKTGKLTPALRDWGLSYASQDPTGFELWVSKAPVIVAGGADPNLVTIVDVSTHSSGLTATELAVCSQLGITREAYIASKPKGA